MAVETALDWFRRSSKKRRRHRHSKSGPNNDDVDDDDESLNATITTATDAAWTFLRYGRSGIAPIDAAWKRCRNDERQRQRHRPKDRYQPLHEPQNCLPPPPVVVLEGPRDVGKTWMLLTLAARYVVETRASKFDNVVGNKDAVDTDDTDGTENNHEESDNNNKSESRPKVLLLDSSYDFSISQLVYVVQQRLRLVHQQQHQETISANDNVDNHDGHNGEQQQEQQQQQQQEQHSRQPVCSPGTARYRGGRPGWDPPGAVFFDISATRGVGAGIVEISGHIPTSYIYALRKMRQSSFIYMMVQAVVLHVLLSSLPSPSPSPRVRHCRCDRLYFPRWPPYYSSPR